MTSRLAEFMAARAAETYAEPLDAGHSFITAQMAPLVTRHCVGIRVLDVGCGQGPALAWFAANGLDATGITTNADDLSACNAAGHEVWCYDMHAIGDHFAPEVFDLVWARHVLEHSVIPFFTLTEFARVLKAGGILYAEMPSPNTACCHESNRNHYSVLGLEMWKHLIVRSGFELLEVRLLRATTPIGPDVYFSIIARKL